MRFGVLGPLIAIQSTKSLELGGPKQRTVLAVLLASEGDRVSADLLIEAVYGERAHDRARRTIQTYVANLRRVLGDAIEAEDRGWRLDLSEHQFDAGEFEERYHRAVQSESEPGETLEALDSALGLWRGEPYEGIDARGRLQGEVARLRELKLGAEVARIEAALAEGLQAEVVADTESLMAQFPYHERLRAQHILALYRSGRQHDALTSYAEMRELLARELGVEPSVELQELEQKILQQHPSLDLTPTSTIRTGANSVESADTDPTHNLPVDLAGFVGREDELERARELISESRLVTLTGPGGSGKTRLAVHAAGQMFEQFPDGIWFVNLASLDDADLVPAEVARALGLQPSSEDVADFVCRSIANLRGLLVLDNCEHLLEGVVPLVSSVLRAGPGVKVLATSREPLRVEGEAVCQVPPMSVPPEGVDSDAVLEFDSVRLFQQGASLAGAPFNTSSGLEAAAKICRRLDGMPLAINLAAARTASFSPEVILERLDHRFRFLTGGPSTAPQRQRSLEATIAWSYDLLSDQEQILLRRLSVFRGGFDLEGAESVCGTEPLDHFDVFDTVGHLVEKSLVQPTEIEDGVRYSMLETVSQYAAHRFADTDEVETINRRHAEYFLGLAEEADAHSRGADARVWFDRIDAELDNLRKAMGWALGKPVPQLAQELVGSLRRYFIFRFRAVEGAGWALRAVDVSDEPTSSRAKALLAAGTLQSATPGHVDAAIRHLDEAIELAKSLGLDDVLQVGLHNRQIISGQRGDWEEVERVSHQLMELARNHDEPLRRVYPLLSLSAIVRDHEQDLPLAIEHAQEALRIAEAAESETATYTARMALARAYRAARELDRAGEILEEVEKSLDRPESEFPPGYLRFMQALLAADRGEFHRAAVLHREHMLQSEEVPEPHRIPKDIDWAQRSSARLLHHLGASEVSAQILGATDALLGSQGFIRPPRLAEDFQRVVKSVRDELGEQAFETLYQRGRQLSREEAFEKVLGTLNKIIDYELSHGRSESDSH